MTTINKKIDYKAIIIDTIKSSIQETNSSDKYIVEVPPKKEMGNYAFPCFQLAKALKKAPPVIAKELFDKINSNLPKEFIKVEALGPYLNFYLDEKKFIHDTFDYIISMLSFTPQEDLSKKILIDFSSPNIAKPFSIGHLRSTVIGNSLYEIYRFLGFSVERINHLGDWGTQFGKMIRAYELWGKELDESENKISKSYELYVRFHKELESNPSLEDEARNCFKKLEDGCEKEKTIWKMFCDITLNYIMTIYKKLNVSFDKYWGESFYNDKLIYAENELNKKALLKESEDAQIVDLSDYDLPPALIKKKDGTTLYMTRDLAAALFRKETFNHYKSLYVVAYQQNTHFKQLFKIIELLGHDWYNELIHVNFGLVHIQGKMGSTRDGNVIFLEDVINEVKNLALQKLNETKENSDLTSEELEERAEQLSVSAIIFHDLKHNRINDIDFDWEEILNPKGDTGVYIQYNYARLHGILNKFDITFNSSWSLQVTSQLLKITETNAFSLATLLYNFEEKVSIAAEQFEPSIIARYLLDLAREFSAYYTENKVINPDSYELSIERLHTVNCVRIILGKGLELLGIKPIKRI